MDKNTNGGVKVSITFHFFLKTRNDQFSESKTKRKVHALSLQQQTTHFFSGPVSVSL